MNFQLLLILGYKLFRLGMRVFCIFSINSRRILFESYKGRSYSCNPKYICEYLNEYHTGKYELVWVFNEPDLYKDLPNIRVIKKNSLKYFYYHMTSRVIIVNMTDAVYIPRRKKQTVINTWHAGGAYKRVGLSYETIQTPLMKWQNKMAGMETSWYISSSDYFTKYNIKEAYNYNGKILNSGMPRNDVFFNSVRQNYISCKVRDYFHVKGKIIVLYAPTFRGDYSNTRSISSLLPFSSVLGACQERYNKEVVVFNRSHYADMRDYDSEDSRVINVNNYSDMQELLIASDLLITDYSSSIWDYALTEKPCILYMPDMEEYIVGRGTYTPVDQWPGLITRSEDELIQTILHLDNDVVKHKAEESLMRFGSYEVGTAAEQIYERIIKEATSGK